MNRFSILLPLLFLAGFSEIQGQENPVLDYEEIYKLAMENNSELKASTLRVDESKALVSNAFSFDKTELYYHYDENNLAYNDKPLKVYGISQEFLFPTRYFADKKRNKAGMMMENSSHALRKKNIEKILALNYYNLQYELEKQAIYKQLDSFYTRFAYAASRRFEIGETNYLEKITAQAKHKQLQTRFKQSEEDVHKAILELKEVVQSDSVYEVKRTGLKKLEVNSMSLEENPGLEFFEQQKVWVQAQKSSVSQSLLPDISLNYFQGSNATLPENLSGYQIGLKFPILFSGNASRIKASKIAQEIVNEEAIDYKIKLETKQSKLYAQLKKYDEVLSYYQVEGKDLSEEIFKTAQFSYESGEINFFQYIQSIENALDITLEYLLNLNAYNKTIIEINYLTL